MQIRTLFSLLLPISIIYYSCAMNKEKSLPKKKDFPALLKFKSELKEKSKKEKRELAKVKLRPA